MGVDISHIIKHEFREVENKDASIEFCKKTIARLNKNLLINKSEEDFHIYCDEYAGVREITFRLPVYDVEFTLHNGILCHTYEIKEKKNQLCDNILYLPL